MPRSVRSPIDNRSARLRLPGRKPPYWVTLERGLALGYHRPLSGGAGTWWGRTRVGRRYRIGSFATADDYADSNGEKVLSWGQAQVAVRSWASGQTSAGPLTVAQAVADYVGDLRVRKGDRAAEGVIGRLDLHLLPALGTRRVSDLTTAELMAWRNSLVSGNDEEAIRRSRDTGNRVLGMAKAVFNLAFTTGRVADDRAWRRVRRFPGVGEARMVFLTDTDLQALVDHARPDLKPMIMFAAWTGARWGELRSLRVSDFDQDRGMVSVRGKTGPRSIHLHPAASELLRQLVRGRRPADHVFMTAAGRPWAPTEHRRPFAAAVRASGIDPRTVGYSLRHTWISRALTAGVPMQAVAEHAGTSVAMITKHYGKFHDADRQAYADLAAPVLRIESRTEQT